MKKVKFLLKYYWILVLLVIGLVAIDLVKSDKQRKEVVCWGDSLTAPHTRNNIYGIVKRLIGYDLSYPEYLQKELGNEYEIVNAGVSGETTLTVMARQGAYPMAYSKDVVFHKNKNGALEHNGHITFISTYNGSPVYPLINDKYIQSSFVNPCVAGNIKGVIVDKSLTSGKILNNREAKYYFEPENDGDTSIIIKAGTTVGTYAMNNFRGKYANIFFIGTNGGYKNNADLIKQLCSLIEYSNSERYIVISQHIPNAVNNTIPKLIEMEDSLSQRFGKNFINLRNYLVERGLKDAGLKPTKADFDSISKGAVPPQLMKDGIHFTKKGYKLIADLVYDKMQELDY